MNYIPRFADPMEEAYHKGYYSFDPRDYDDAVNPYSYLFDMDLYFAWEDGLEDAAESYYSKVREGYLG